MKKRAGKVTKQMATDDEKQFAVTEIGTTGLNRQAGQIDEEFLRQLKGTKAVSVYKEMAQNDAVVGAIIFAIEMLIRQVKWGVEPASSEPADVEVADYVESCRNDMSSTWADLISEILSMLTYGWAYFESVYKQRMGATTDPKTRSQYSDGKIGWRKIALRAQDTLYKWEFDAAGGIRGMWQSAPPDYVTRFIPIEKSLLFRTTVHKGNPEGRSILRNAYRSWYFKKRFEEIEGIGIERDLAGLPVAYVPSRLLSITASPEEKSVVNLVAKIIKNIRRDEQEGVVFPLAYDEKGNSLFKFELVSSGSRRQFDTNLIIGRYDQRIAMTVLADFILLGHEKVGSFSLSQDKSRIFATALTAWLDAIVDVFNRIEIPRLVLLNDFRRAEMPKLVHGAIEAPNLTELSTFIKTLSDSGMPLFPDDALENYIRNSAGLPSPSVTKNENT